MFKFVEKFIVCNFNQFLDHAPLHLQICISGQHCEKLGQDTSSGGLCAPSIKWNSEKIHEGRLALERNLNKITSQIFSCSYDTAKNIDLCVKLFTNDLQEVLIPHLEFKVRHPTRPPERTRNTPASDIHRAYMEDKPWFTNTCKQKYRNYICALAQFNKNKSEYNRLNLHAVKHIYKK